MIKRKSHDEMDALELESKNSQDLPRFIENFIASAVMQKSDTLFPESEIVKVEGGEHLAKITSDRNGCPLLTTIKCPKS